MPVFELFQPATVDDALGLLDRHGADAWILAGGLDTFDWLKDRAKRTNVVIDMSQMTELRGIKEVDGGLEIGALTTLTEVVKHPVVREKFGLLMEAADLVASPQIRNQGTLGGNVSQDTRCWYYRSGWSCYRAGGNICYADTPTAINREHAILQADRCVAVSPSDTAPALIALDAQMVLRPGELLTAIRIPATWAGAQFYFEKVRDRQVWDFPLVNVASAMQATAGTITQMRIVVGAVAATPVRLRAATTITPAHAAGMTSTRTASAPCCSRPVFSGFRGGSSRFVGFHAKPEPHAMRWRPARTVTASPKPYWR